ncbi:MAG: spherulation-specific family 4 protein, partial [Nitrosotalea sp.]
MQRWLTLTFPFFTIVNPADGPGRKPPTCVYQGNPLDNLTQDYQFGIGNLTRAGIVVLGYVDTINDTTGIQKQYGQVTQEIDTWTICYPGIQGMLLDDMQTWPFTTGNLTYYQNLTNYIHDKKLQYSFGNPGTDVDPQFLDTVDVMNIFENGTLPQDSILQGASDWHLRYDKSHFMFVAYNQPALPNAIWIQKEAPYVKYMFFTNYTLPNPWSSIPSYLSTELADLDTQSVLVKINAVEQNGSNLPGPLVQVSQQINQTYNLARTENTPFDYNTTSGLMYKITAQLCYGNWRFNHWQIAPLWFNHKQHVAQKFNHWKNIPSNHDDSTMYVFPT